MSGRVFLNLTGGLAQVFPFGQGLSHAVALLPDGKEGLVVAADHGVVLQVGLGSF